MRQIFRSKFKVTQEFGVNPEYYKKFGLTAHEGIDIIPTGSDWTVYALEDGVVVKDEDNAKSGAYGKYVTIWHPSIKKATQYCHLASNIVDNGIQVKKGQAIGVMGSTGNTSGAHVHLNLFNVDDNGVRLNRDNGYLGGINPLPFLEEVEVVDNQKLIDELRNDRDRNWQLYQTEIEKNKQLSGEVVRLNGEITELKNANTTLLNKIEYLTKAQEQDAVSDRDLEVKNTELEHKITELNQEIEDLKKQKEAPIEPIVEHYENIIEKLWPNLYKSKKTKSLIERLWKWLR